MYLALKYAHTAFAALTITGFLLRGYWLASGSERLRRRSTKVVPHVVDALFLGTGIWLVVLLHIDPLQHAWLLAKFAGVLAYISLGMVALRFAQPGAARLAAFVAAVAAFAYIVGAALLKSPSSWLVYV